jgi:vesicle-associated membrane protein 72
MGVSPWFQADNFHRTGRALRRRMWWQNLKMKLMLAGRG